MTKEQKIGAIVFAYDLHTLGIFLDIPDEARSQNISVTILEKYAPSFLERVTKITMEACYHSYMQKNPESNFREFRLKFLGSRGGFEVYKQTLAKIEEKLIVKLDAATLEKFCKDRNPNATKVDTSRTNLNPNQIEVPKNFKKS